MTTLRTRHQEVDYEAVVEADGTVRITVPVGFAAEPFRSLRQAALAVKKTPQLGTAAEKFWNAPRGSVLTVRGKAESVAVVEPPVVAKATPPKPAAATKTAPKPVAKANGTHGTPNPPARKRNYRLLRRTPNQTGVAEGMLRIFCDACMRGYVVESADGVVPAACPEGHRADDPELTARTEA